MNSLYRAPRDEAAAVNAWTMEQITCCPICGGQSLRQRFRVTHLGDGPLFAWAREGPYTSSVIVGCRDCSFLFKSPRPSWEILEARYARSDEVYLENLAEDDLAFRTDFRLASFYLRKAYRNGARILDIGCGRGFFLHRLGDRWDRYAVEASARGAEYARQKHGLKVQTGDVFVAGFPDQFFDVISCFDVIEHLPQPVPFLAETRRILKVGGLLILGTANSTSWTARLAGGQWTYFLIPEHVSFFNRGSMRTALLRAGYAASRFRKLHHGTLSVRVVRGWLRAVARYWVLSCLGDGVTRFPLFRQKTGQLPVPYFFDHFICLAS